MFFVKYAIKQCKSLLRLSTCTDTKGWLRNTENFPVSGTENLCRTSPEKFLLKAFAMLGHVTIFIFAGGPSTSFCIILQDLKACNVTHPKPATKCIFALIRFNMQKACKACIDICIVSYYSDILKWNVFSAANLGHEKLSCGGKLLAVFLLHFCPKMHFITVLRSRCNLEILLLPTMFLLYSLNNYSIDQVFFQSKDLLAFWCPRLLKRDDRNNQNDLSSQTGMNLWCHDVIIANRIP